MGRGSNDLSLNVVLQASDLASGRLKGFGSTLVNLAGDAGPLLKVFGGISLAAVAMGVAAVQSAADFQQSMLKNQALAGLTQQQYTSMSNSILALAPQVGQAPKALADSLYYVLSAGIPASKALDAVRYSAMLADSGLTSTSTTANALTTVMKVFGLSSKQAADQITKAVADGKMTMEQYANSIGKLSLTAKTANRSVYETNAALDVLTNNGFPSAAQASTGLSQLFTQMDIKTETLAAKFDKLQPAIHRTTTVMEMHRGHLVAVTKTVKEVSDAFDVQAFKSMDLAHQIDYLNKMTHGNSEELLKIFNGSKQALQAFQALSGDAKGYSSALKDMKTASSGAGAAQVAFDTTLKGLKQQLANAQAAFQSLLVIIGTNFLPILTQIVSVVAPAVNWLMNFATAVSKNEVAMAFLKGALVGFAVVIAAILIPAFYAWAVAAGAAALATLAATWPILLIGAIVAVVVAGIILAVQHWGSIVQWLKGAWANIASFFQGLWQGILSGLQAVGNFFVSVWNGIVSGVQTAWNWIVNAAKIGAEFLLGVILGPFLAIGALFIWLYQHNTYFQRMIDAIVNFVRSGVAWLQQAWSNVVTFIAVQWVRLSNWANEQWSKIIATITVYLSIVNSAIQTVWTIISGWLSAQWNKIAGFASAAWAAVSLVFSSIWSKYISGPLSSLWSQIQKWFANLGKGAADSGHNFINMLVDGITSGAGAIWNAVVNIAQTIWKALGFHSPPAGGPLADADRYMPNFISMMSRGLTAGVPQMQQAAYQLATPLARVNPAETGGYGSIPYGRPPVSSSNAYNNSVGGANYHYYGPVTVVAQGANAKEVAKEVMEIQSRAYRRSGDVVVMTSGGRSA